MRRQMYLGEMRRKQTEEAFTGPQEEFLASLGMVFTISPARAEDLARAEETPQTAPINSTPRDALFPGKSWRSALLRSPSPAYV